MRHAISISPDIGGKPRWRGVDGTVVELAVRQHGIVTRKQLLAMGFGERAIDHRLEQGRLHPQYRGVYTVGQPHPSREGRWMAAVFAGGRSTVLSHRSAAALWGIHRSQRELIELTTPMGRTHRPGIQFHRSSLPLDEVTYREGIPVTTVARTLLDLGIVLNPRQLERAINEAEVLQLWDETSLAQLLSRYPRRPGSGAVRAVMRARQEGATVTRSELEERFLALIDGSGLSRPEGNAIVERMEVDFVWRDAGLIVELDGRAFHSTARAFERDRERDRILQAAGWRVVRVTWRQLEATPEQVVADLQALIRG